MYAQFIDYEYDFFSSKIIFASNLLIHHSDIFISIIINICVDFYVARIVGVGGVQDTQTEEEILSN